MRYPLLALISCTLLLSACGLLPNRSALAEHESNPTPFTASQRWWQPLNDPLIDVLADELVAENMDMKMALARIDEARGLRRAAGSGLLPEIGVGGEATRGNRQNPTTESVAVGGFDASWEIDLFGRIRSGMEAADAGIDAANANAEDMRNSMVAELVRATIEWRAAQETIRVTRSLITSQDDQISLIRSRKEAGLVDGSEYERALAQREQTATQLPLAVASAKNAQYQIERLLAKQPGDLDSLLAFYADETPHLPTAADVLELDISSLSDRPDVRAAQAALAARDAELAQAASDLWPRLSLQSFFGGQSSSSGALIAPNPLWSVAAAASMPLLNFGRIRGAINAADARAKHAALSYQNATLIALQETHSALSDFLNGLDAVKRQESSLGHRQTSVSLANERFSNGLTDMTDLTTSQSELDEATLDLIRRKAATGFAFVRLHKALGSATKVDAEPTADEPSADAPQDDEPIDPNDPNDPNAMPL